MTSSTKNVVERKDRKDSKNDIRNVCIVCSLTDFDEDVTLEKCGTCNFYCYCGKACQLYQWKDQNHMGECRQLTILNKYHKPYENEFREAIKCGEDPKTIFPLQVLREKLGLTRPRKDYVDLMGKDSLDRYTLLIPRKDGTVLIGSTPEVI